MTDPALYPEIISHLQRQIKKGREAEKLLRSDNPILPIDMLEKLVEKGKESQFYLERLRLIRDEVEPQRKYYTEEFPSGPWSRYLYEKIHGKFDEEEFHDENVRVRNDNINDDKGAVSKR